MWISEAAELASCKFQYQKNRDIKRSKFTNLALNERTDTPFGIADDLDVFYFSMFR